MMNGNKKGTYALAVFVLLLLPTILFLRRDKSRSEAFFSMDTFFEITSLDKKLDNQVVQEVESLIQSIDNRMNSYNPNSEISLINQFAGVKDVPVSQDTWKVVKQSIHLSDVTGGLFDITFQPLQDLYGFKEGVFHVPSPREIETTRQKVNYQKILLNEKTHTIMLKEPGMIINLSGLLKGYVLDCVKEFLLEKGFTNFLLNFGGNLCVYGNQTEPIGIKHPRKESILYSFPLMSGFVSTSADYQQFFEENGKRYTHIVNPKTGSCIHYMQSVTVVADTGILSDLLSTTLFLLEPEKLQDAVTHFGFPISYFATDGTEEYSSK